MLHPSRAARRIDASLFAASQIGGCGVCTGRGSITTSRNFQNFPSWEKRWLLLSALRRNDNVSSNRSGASDGFMQKPSNSCGLYPLPTPKSKRPPESRSSVATDSARSAGLCHGSTITAVPRRMRDVRAARYVSSPSVGETELFGEQNIIDISSQTETVAAHTAGRTGHRSPADPGTTKQTKLHNESPKSTMHSANPKLRINWHLDELLSYSSAIPSSMSPK